MPTKEELNHGFEIGEWEVFPARGEMRCGDQIERPEPKVFDLLLALAIRDGEVVTRDELVAEVWGGRAMPDDPIIRCIHQLRHRLGDTERPFQYVDTLTKRGYRLIKEVRLLEPPEPSAKVDTGERKKIRRTLILGIASVVVAVIAVFIILGQKPKIGSIGVLPFENLSSDLADQYLPYGFKEELVKTLHNIPDFSVTPGRVRYEGLEVTEIAAKLDVESVLSGSVQRVGDVLKISYNVALGSGGKIRLSGSITGPREEIFALQESLAVEVRNALLGKSKLQLRSSSRPESNEGYDRYMRGLYALEHRGQSGKLEEATDLFKETIELDPQFGPAYLSLAMLYALLPDYRDAPLEETHALAVSIVEQGITVDDSIRDAANAIFGFVHQKQRNWTLAEQAYLKATAARAVESTAFHWHSLMLASVGRLDDALEKALAAQRIDPSSAVINSRIAIAYTWLDDNDNAAKFFARTEQLGGGDASYRLSHALWLRRQGRMDETRQVLADAVEILGDRTNWFDPVFAAMRDPAQVELALAAVNVAAADQAINLRVEVYLRALLGDIDGAIRAANALTRPGETLGTDFLFLPELLPVRQHAGFLELMDDLGITEYWDNAGCIWQGTAVKCTKSL
jgi:DNA-binding winged helix-turn-helix (wHTH) protein/TolB-like protein